METSALPWATTGSSGVFFPGTSRRNVSCQPWWCLSGYFHLVAASVWGQSLHAGVPRTQYLFSRPPVLPGPTGWEGTKSFIPLWELCLL